MSDEKHIGLSRASQKRKRKLNSTKNAPIARQITDEPVSQERQSDSKDRQISSKKRYSMRSYQVHNMRLIDILEEEDGESNTAWDKASKLLSLIIDPISLQFFYDDYWDKRPMHIVKNQKLWLKGFITSKSITSLWESHLLKYNEDIRLTKYFNDTFFDISDSVELKDDNIALKDINAALSDDYCLTLLQPQRYHDKLWKLLSSLEFEFNNLVSCHLYYFPGVCQGYNHEIPTHNTILVQLAGDIKVEVFEVSDESTDIPHTPYLSTILHHGDSFYIPSGYAFKLANTAADISVCLSVNVAISKIKSLIELIAPQAIESSGVKSKSSLNQHLPLDYLSFMGVSASDSDPSIEVRRSAFYKLLKTGFEEVVNEAIDMADAAADQLAKKFLCERLPVPITSVEENATSVGSSNSVINSYTHLRMLRPGIARAIIEDGLVVVYHCMDNARYLYGAPINPLEFELDDGPAIEELLNAYPNSVVVEELYHPSEELDDKISIARALFKEGFLMIMDEASRPSQQLNEEDDDPF